MNKFSINSIMVETLIVEGLNLMATTGLADYPSIKETLKLYSQLAVEHPECMHSVDYIREYTDLQNRYYSREKRA